MHRRHMLRVSLASFLMPMVTGPAQGAARRYGLGANGAEIAYIFSLNGSDVRGSVPVSRADLQIDPGNLTASQADVSADMRRARTGLIFATEAMKSRSVLDASRFPEARFQSTRVILGPGGRISGGAAIEGRLTLRGVTQPVRFAADLFRKRGSAPGDLSALDVHLNGRINRSDFGATGYANLVADRVRIEIRADITQL